MRKQISHAEIGEEAKVLAKTSNISLGKARLQLIWRYASDKNVDFCKMSHTGAVDNDLDFTDKPPKPQGVVYVPPKT